MRKGKEVGEGGELHMGRNKQKREKGGKGEKRDARMPGEFGNEWK